MIDLRLRPLKDRALEPLAARLAGRVAPITLSVLGVVCCVGGAVLVWQSLPLLGTVAWLAGRLLDGLDGPVARRNASDSDLGGYADLLLDTLGYAAVPIGVAAAAGDTRGWMIAAIVLATFYLNAVSLLMLSSILEKQRHHSTASSPTTVAMPPALIEGSETIVLLAAAMAIPAWAPAILAAMAVGVALGIVQRWVNARRLIGER